MPFTSTSTTIPPTLSHRFLPSPSRRLATPALPSCHRSLPHPTFRPPPRRPHPFITLAPAWLSTFVPRALLVSSTLIGQRRVDREEWGGDVEEGWGFEQRGCYRKRRTLPGKCKRRNKQTCAVSTLALIWENCVITFVLKPEAPTKMSITSVDCVIIRTNQTTWITFHDYIIHLSIRINFF